VALIGADRKIVIKIAGVRFIFVFCLLGTFKDMQFEIITF